LERLNWPRLTQPEAHIITESVYHFDSKLVVGGAAEIKKKAFGASAEPELQLLIHCCLALIVGLRLV